MTRSLKTWVGPAALLAAVSLGSPARGDAPKYTEEELAALAREGPKPESKSQRFLPDFARPPPPAEASTAPSKTEWLTAPDATDVRITDPSCSAKRLREWYRVQCADGYVSKVSGQREGVQVGAVQDEYTAWVVFPAREGDRRVFVFLRRTKWSIASDAVVSEQWLPGDPAPLVTVSGIAD